MTTTNPDMLSEQLAARMLLEEFGLADLQYPGMCLWSFF